MKEGQPNIKREIMLRVKLLYAVFFLVGLCIFGRILWLQYGPKGNELREKAEKTNFTLARVDAARGEIMSADGQLLATSVQKYYVGIDFRAQGLTKELFDGAVDGLAAAMSRKFGDRSKAQYKNLLQSGWNNRQKTRYRQIAPRIITYNELQELCTFPLFNLPSNRGGRVVNTVTERVRPFGKLAERTIGRTVEVRDTLVKPGRDSTKRSESYVLTERGQSGIEFSFNGQLKGQSGWQMQQKIANNFYIPVMESELNVEPVNGRDITTTLDMDFQDVASSMLERQLVRNNALWGTVVLMEVATGEIKAMANLSNHNGNCVEDYNYALGGANEPGSTFKLASLLALLDDGMKLDDDVRVGNGKLSLRGANFSDDHEPESSVITLKRVFETSSNVGFVEAVEKRFKEKNREKDYVDYIVNLGFDRPLGTGMAGETVPVFHRPSPEEIKSGSWSRNSISYMSHGYGFEISPLHTLTLYNAVAGGGRMVRPMLVKEISEYGVPVRIFHTEVINPSIAPSRTIDAVRESLEGVVDEGTASVLKNPWYKVAAKTGTAQQLTSGRYQRGGAGQMYMATMVGYFPADAPRYSIIVAIGTRVGAGAYNFYGSSLAGPVFKAVADRVYVTHHEWQAPIDRSSERVIGQPTVKGGSMLAVRKVARELGIKLDDNARRSDMVLTRLSDDSTSVAATAIPRDGGTVPPLIGMGLKDALYAIESRGLRADFSGKGRVVAQHPEAGTAVRRGAMVTITLK